MVNIQESMQIGFRHLSSEIRSLSSSAQPQPQISNPRRKSIEHHYHKGGSDEGDGSDRDSNFEDERDDDIEEIIPIYEDQFPEGGTELEDSQLQEDAQKQLVKKKRKEIRVRFFIIMLA
jgi:hypothetical protein